MLWGDSANTAAQQLILIWASKRSAHITDRHLPKYDIISRNIWMNKRYFLLSHLTYHSKWAKNIHIQHSLLFFQSDLWLIHVCIYNLHNKNLNFGCWRVWEREREREREEEMKGATGRWDATREEADLTWTAPLLMLFNFKLIVPTAYTQVRDLTSVYACMSVMLGLLQRSNCRCHY